MSTIARPRVVVHVRIPMVMPARDADDGDPDDGRPACGWFDSSRALREGLAVQELGICDVPDDGTLAALWLAALAAPVAESARRQ